MDKTLEHKSRTILWVDYDNRDSYKLCLGPYGLTCLMAVDVDADTVELTVYGETANVDRFLEDIENDCIEPLESMSTSLEYDEDYEGWLNNEVYWFDKLAAYEAGEYDPNDFFAEEEDEPEDPFV